MNLNNKSIIAITGPSGAGKTTLGNKLSTINRISIPCHCTTRTRRNDDQDGFYRYLTHDEYRTLYQDGKFLISSGDGPIISKEYGNFYGILKDDCFKAWNVSNMILLFVSYKDISQLISLSEMGLDIEIVNLTFTNIEKGVSERLKNDTVRNHTERDILNRIKCALNDTEKYGEMLKQYATAIIYTDILNIDQTYQEVCKKLKLTK